MSAGTCKNCGSPYLARVGRGLCRSCWDQPEVRERFPPLATFGGGSASKLAGAKLTRLKHVRKILALRAATRPVASEWEGAPRFELRGAAVVAEVV